MKSIYYIHFDRIDQITKIGPRRKEKCRSISILLLVMRMNYIYDFNNHGEN
jgi:hypothetical protein